MSNQLFIRPLRHGEEVEVCNLVVRVFNEFIAPGFTEEGKEEFFRYVNPRALHRRQRTGYKTLIAEFEDKIVGVVEVKRRRHISMLYVDKAYHKKGIASELLKRALEYIISSAPMIKEVTVNSSKYAAPFYERAGFQRTEGDKVIHGILHVPMSLSINRKKAANT